MSEQVLSLTPNDVLVVRAEGRLTSSEMKAMPIPAADEILVVRTERLTQSETEALRERLQEHLPNCNSIVLNGVELEAVPREDLRALLEEPVE